MLERDDDGIQISKVVVRLALATRLCQPQLFGEINCAGIALANLMIKWGTYQREAEQTTNMISTVPRMLEHTKDT